MKSLLTSIFLILFHLVSFSQKSVKIKEGNWTAALQLTEKEALPFQLIIQKTKKQYEFIIVNGEEKIKLNDIEQKEDSLIVSFSEYNSQLVFKPSKTNLKGYWLNKNKLNYKLPFSANFGYTSRFKDEIGNKPINVNGKWKVYFSPKTKSEYVAIGLFKQHETKLTGTFLTETGDFRFLEGNQFGNQLYLSCFDGSHAFLFKAKIENDSIKGKFYSGKHYEDIWEGVNAPNFELTNPYEITKPINNSPLSFSCKDLDGNTFQFPNEQFKNKAVIIQIMGTWCPNCTDETNTFKELYKEYQSKGFEFIAIGFENGKEEDCYALLKKFKEKKNIQYTVLYGGNAKRATADIIFTMLDGVKSFPTTIYIGKDGLIKKVYSGFNGPGTGEYYDQYLEQTKKLIEEMVR